MRRQWRRPTKEDRTRKCYARCDLEKRKFYVEWNHEHGTWGVAGRPHILVRVDYILEPKT